MIKFHILMKCRDQKKKYEVKALFKLKLNDFQAIFISGNRYMLSQSDPCLFTSQIYARIKPTDFPELTFDLHECRLVFSGSVFWTMYLGIKQYVCCL